MQFLEEKATEVLIQRECGDFLSIAKRALRSWMAVKRMHCYSTSPLPPVVKNAAFALDAKICRQFRSVIELCERAESYDATVLARCLFESYLAIEFVLRRQISLRVYKKKYGAQSPRSMPRRLRASLYLTFFAYAGVAFKARSEAYKTPRIKRHARRLASWPSSQVLKDYESLIGRDWAERFQKRPFTYSALSVAGLTETLGGVIPRWYSVIYSLQSSSVHVSDVAGLLHSESRWHDSPDEVERSLQAAMDVYLAGVSSLHKHMEFGPSVDMLLSGLEEEYEQIKVDRCKRRSESAALVGFISPF